MYSSLLFVIIRSSFRKHRSPTRIFFKNMYYFFSYFYFFIYYYYYNFGLFILIVHFFHQKNNKLHVGLLTIQIRIYEMRDRKNFVSSRELLEINPAILGKRYVPRMWRYLTKIEINIRCVHSTNWRAKNAAGSRSRLREV